MMEHILPLIPLEQFANKPQKDGLLDAIIINKILRKTLLNKNKEQTQQAWIDFQKAFDLISHTHLIQTWEKLGIDDNIIKIMKQAIKYWSFTLANSLEKNENNKNK